MKQAKEMHEFICSSFSGLMQETLLTFLSLSLSGRSGLVQGEKK